MIRIYKFTFILYERGIIGGITCNNCDGYFVDTDRVSDWSIRVRLPKSSPRKKHGACSAGDKRSLLKKAILKGTLLCYMFIFCTSPERPKICRCR